jgi:hypothetical protein
MRDPLYKAARRVIAARKYRARLLAQGAEPRRLARVERTIARNLRQHRAIKILMLELEGGEELGK